MSCEVDPDGCGCYSQAHWQDNCYEVMLARNGCITGQTINVNGGWYMS